MVTYLIRRIFQSFVFIFLASLIMYTAVVMFMPGGPKRQVELARQSGWITRSDLPGRSVEDINNQYKIDKPWPLNYFLWLFDPSDTTSMRYNDQNVLVTVPKGIDWHIGNIVIRGSGVLVGDFGETPTGNTTVSVTDRIGDRWPNSFYLLMTAFVLTVAIGIPLGIIGAIRKGSATDHALTVFSLGGIAIPPYVLSYVFIIFLAIGLKSLHDVSGWSWIPWFPPGGAGSDNIWDRAYHVALPAATLAIPQIARIARHTRFAMLDVLKQDYVRTARAKGLGFRAVFFKHALRNSLLAIITQTALFIPLYISAGAVVENSFGYYGLGREFYRSVGGCLFNSNLMTTDPPACRPGLGFASVDAAMALPLLLIMVVLIALSVLIADILYVVADPRISYKARGKAG